MNKQEIFDKVWLGFEKQNWARSVDINGDCVYRGNGGTCCAIGLLIPDELYDPVIEGIGMFSVINNHDKTSQTETLRNILETLGLLGESIFLEDMQAIHDSSRDSENLKNNFIELANIYNLKILNQ